MYDVTYNWQAQPDASLRIALQLKTSTSSFYSYFLTSYNGIFKQAKLVTDMAIWRQNTLGLEVILIRCKI